MCNTYCIYYVYILYTQVDISMFLFFKAGFICAALTVLKLTLFEAGLELSSARPNFRTKGMSLFFSAISLAPSFLLLRRWGLGLYPWLAALARPKD